MAKGDKLLREEILNHPTREQICEIVTHNPGINLSGLMKKLDIDRGTLSYHVNVLEREKYIKSEKGKYCRRFYTTKNLESISKPF